MIPRAFDYVRAHSLAHAFDLLAESDDGKLIAGGHSLLPMMKLRMAAPSTLIDIIGLSELHGIHIDASHVRIGAATSHSAIELHAGLAAELPLLHQVAVVIADATVRNRGTIGGALAQADPSADWPAAMLALDATFEIARSDGSRSIGAANFF